MALNRPFALVCLFEQIFSDLPSPAEASHERRYDWRGFAQAGKDHALSARETSPDVYALFDAAVGKQLQGAARAGPAGDPISADRGGYSQGRQPYPGIFGEEPQRPGATS